MNSSDTITTAIIALATAVATTLTVVLRAVTQRLITRAYDENEKMRSELNDLRIDREKLRFLLSRKPELESALCEFKERGSTETT